MAPEIYESEPFDARSADLFAAAVTLFKMFFGFIPFYIAKMKQDKSTAWDEHATMVMCCKWKDFWASVSIHDLKTNVPVPSDDLKELF